jgi:TonB-linked SusC/RagA family outer membrane protein
MRKIWLLLVSLLFSYSLWAQTHTIKGKVVDEIGNGFPGAGVTIKGTSAGTVTDLEGNFQLDVPDNKNTLVIQAVGYATQEVAAAEGMTIRLKVAAKELQGAVVTALGIKRERRELGYSTQTVNNEELTTGNNTSSLSALQGKVAGANITSSTGGPGGSTRIVLRGEKSMTKDNNALIIIDGVITTNIDRTRSNELEQVDFGNSANDVNPDDIESITVLNGAQASALYGSIGANGAVMITTKSGKQRTKSKGMEVTYKATYTQSDILKYPTLQHEFGQGNIYAGIADDRRENFSWGNKFDNQMRPWGQIIDGQQLVKPYSDQPNNIKSFFNHGKDLNNYVSLAGGNDNSTYFLSLNALNSSGVIPNTFYNKYSIRFNGTTQLSNNFYSSINLNYINTYSRQPNEGQNIGSVLDNLLEIPRDIPVWELKQLDNKFYSMSYLDASGIARYGYYGAYYKNPYWAASEFDNRDRSDRMLGDITLGWKKGKVDIFDRVGADIISDNASYKSPAFNSQPVDPFYAGDPYISPGGYAENYLSSIHFNNDLIGKYTQSFSDNFGMNLLVGDNIRINSDRNLSATIDPNTNGLVIPGWYNFQNAQGAILVNNPVTNYRNTGIYGDLTLNYKREVFLDLTARNDWSSTLAPGHNSYFYPSASVSWVFTERLSDKLKKIINYGKLRANIAQVGNDAPPYSINAPGYVQTVISNGYGTSLQYPLNGIPGFAVQNQFGDSSLKPEITRTYEIGTDLSFLNDKINLTFNYYDARSTNQINAVPLPPSTGFGYQTINLGTVRNYGEEVTLRITPLSIPNGLRWTLFGTFTHNTNVVEGLSGGASQVTLGGYSGMAIVAVNGKPYGTFYGSDFQRDPQGHVIVDATTGQPLINSTPTYLGSFQPKFIMSFGTDLSYKGLKLHVLFNDHQGGLYYSRNKTNMDFNGTSAGSAANDRQPYVWENSVNAVTQNGTTTYVKNTTKFVPYDYYTNTEQFTPATGLVNASYVKLQEVSLYYTLPQKWYQHSPFGMLEVGLFGNNLIIWTAKSNKYDDPEESSVGATGNGQGFNFTANPSVRNYGASLRVTF